MPQVVSLPFFFFFAIVSSVFLLSLALFHPFFPTCFVPSLLPSISSGSLSLFRAQRATQGRCMSWHAGDEQTHAVSKLWCNSVFGVVWWFLCKYVYFRRLSCITVWMIMSVSLSVHRFGPKMKKKQLLVGLQWNFVPTVTFLRRCLQLSSVLIWLFFVYGQTFAFPSVILYV